MELYREQEYRAFLDIQSKDGYVSGLKRVYDLFEEQFPGQSLESYLETAVSLSAGNEESFDTLTQPIIKWLEAGKEFSQEEAIQKFYGNSLSYLRKYLAFLKSLVQEATPWHNSFKEEVLPSARKQRNKTFYRHREYQSWLYKESGLGYNSINSYLSTLRSPKVEAWIGKEVENIPFLIDTTASKAHNHKAIKWLEAITGHIGYRIGTTDSNKAKLLSDYRSHLRKYLEFLYEADSTDDEKLEAETQNTHTEVVTEQLDSIGITQVFDEEALKETFIWRLETQDICPKTKEAAIFYPVRIIATLAKRRSDYRNLFYTILNNNHEQIEVVITANGASIYTRDVVELKISPKQEVFVTDKEGIEHRVYTYNKEQEEWTPMYANTLRDIQIRPRVAKVDVLEDLGSERLPMLKALSDDLKALQHRYNPTNNVELAQFFFNDCSLVRRYGINLSILLQEVKLVLNETELYLQSVH